MLKRVLWIEDGAETELYNMLAPIYIAGEYELVIARDATEAEEKLRTEDFAAVIVDIRLPPGREQKWIDTYKEHRQSRDAARLGLHLLRAIFPVLPGLSSSEEAKKDEDRVRVPVDLGKDIPVSRLAVFSVESDLKQELDSRGITRYRIKSANTPRTEVLDLIRDICG